MIALKCKMCGGDIQAAEGASYGTCESCGSTSTLPKASDERKANLFNRANHFRRQNDFDKAVQAYDNILNEDNADAEAHWGVVLSRYGIEYVEDPATHKRVPTCHRVQNESILKDADYIATLEYAPDEYTKSLYEEEAKKISDIQKGILAISSKEEPYDIFICYKETTDGGSRTKDSTIAQDIYYELTKDGYKVFFAKITLEDKLGQQYEPYIFSALNSAKVMLVIGTRKEHFEAVWVKNEWSRFLAIMKKDRSRLLIPCYRDMDAYDMPEELSSLQSQDMSKIGFLQDILRGVKKVLNVEGNSVEQSVQANVVIPSMFTDKVINDELTKVNRDIIDCESRLATLPIEILRADQNVERLRTQNSKCAEELNARGVYRTLEKLEDPYFKLLADQYTMAINNRHRLQSDLGKDTRSKSELELKKRELEAQLRLKPQERVENHYNHLVDMKKSSLDEKDLIELAKQFRELEGYKDTGALATECEDLALKTQYNRFVDAKNNASTEEQYRTLAKQFAAMNGYKDTVELASECDKLAVDVHYIGLVQNKRSTSTEEEYENLAEQFRAMNGYKNTAELANECDTMCQEAKKRREEHELLEANKRKAQEEERRKQQEEQERFAAEMAERKRIEGKRGRLLSLVLGGIIGGVVFYLLSFIVANYFADNTDSFRYPFGIVLGILCMIGGGGCLGGVIGFIIGAIIATIFVAVSENIVLVIFIGIILGALIGWGMGRKK